MGLYGDTVCLVTHTGQNLLELVTEASSGLSDGLKPSWPDGWEELPDRGFWGWFLGLKNQPERADFLYLIP